MPLFAGAVKRVGKSVYVVRYRVRVVGDKRGLFSDKRSRVFGGNLMWSVCQRYCMKAFLIEIPKKLVGCFDICNNDLFGFLYI